MKKLAVTTALALVLAGSAYAQGHHGGGGGGHGGGGGAQISGGVHGGGNGGAAFNGGAHMGGGGGQAMTSHGASGSSGFSNHGAAQNFNGSGSMRGSQFSRTDRGAQGRTVYNQERSNRSLYNRYDDRDRGHESFSRDRDHESFGGRDRGVERFGRDRDRGMDFRHRGVVRGSFFEHGRHFGFRRFWHDQWVFLTDWDSCTAWAWVHVAPGVFAWRPVDVCIG
jgi:hypothetical protein